MPISTLTDATFFDLSATAVPPQSITPVHGRGFAVKRMDPFTGRALECLAHAIEHIQEKKLSHAASPAETVAADQAIQILKSLNRQIFAELPNLPERRSLLRLIVQKWEFSRLDAEETTIARQ